MTPRNRPRTTLLILGGVGLAAAMFLHTGGQAPPADTTADPPAVAAPTSTAVTVTGTPTPESVVLSTPDGSVRETHDTESGRAGRWTCRYDEVGGTGAADFDILDDAPAITPEPGQLVGLVCRDEAGFQVYRQMLLYDPTDPFGPLGDSQPTAEPALRRFWLHPSEVRSTQPNEPSGPLEQLNWLWNRSGSTR